MIISMAKRPDGFWEPSDPQSEKRCAKFAFGEVMEFKASKVRNPVRHRAYFLMIHLAFENQDFFKDENEFRYWVQMKAGYFNEMKTPKGVVYYPKSISFAKMDEDEFERLRVAVRDVILEELEFDVDESEEMIRLSY